MHCITVYYSAMWTTTNHLRLRQNAPELFSDRPCLNLNSTELGEPEEQSLSAYHLSFFRCYILKVSQLSQMSDLTTALPLQLKKISHHINSMEVLIDDSSASQDCSLPAFEDMDLFLYVKCLLQRLDQRLSNVKFWLH